MYALFLRDHEVNARIGVHDFERGRTQRLIVNVALAIRGEAGADDIAATTDYDFLRQETARIIAEGHLELQETLCSALMRAIRRKPDVAAALVSTEKPDVYPDARGVGCRMAWLEDGVDAGLVQLLFTRPG